MIKLLFPIFIIMCAVGCSSTQDGESRRNSLRQVTSLEFDENYSHARNAFFALMDEGESGHEILSDSLAYDDIPQIVWEQWIHDYCTKRPTAEALGNVDALYRMVDGRLSQEQAYREAFLSIMLADTDDIPYYVFWLAPDSDSDQLKAHQELALEALVIKYSNQQIPSYDVDADEETRAHQFEKILRTIEASN